jgi:mono/diheme cytochrome c family protein
MALEFVLMKIINQPIPMKPGRRPGIFLALLSTAVFALSITFVAADGGTNAPPSPPSSAKPAKAPAKKKLTGAELYQINCNRCHAERYPTEFTPAQWKTLLTHMRVRANLPAAQAKAILKYLQEDSGN